MLTMWLLRLLNRWGWRRDTMAVMHQEDTWRWPPYLGEKTEGKCDKCGEGVYFEIQNAPFRKICNRCIQKEQTC